MDEQLIPVSGEPTISKKTLIDLYNKYVAEPFNKLFILKASQPGSVLGFTYCDTILLNSQGKLLIIQRSYQDDFCPGKWSLPGGKLEFGETFEEGALRELKEETGLTLDSIEEGPVVVKEEAEIHYFEGLIKDSDSLILLDNDEHYRYSWIDPYTELEDYSFLLDLGDFLRDYFEQRLLERIPEIEQKIEDLLPEINKVAPFNPVVKKIPLISLDNSFDIIKSAFERGDVEDNVYLDYLFKYNLLKGKQVPVDTPDNSQDQDPTDDSTDQQSGEVVSEGSQDTGDQPQQDEVRQGDSGDHSEEKLKMFAQQAPEESLYKTIKSSPDPKLREIAHKELDRRKKEEHIQPEPEEGGQQPPQSQSSKSSSSEKTGSKDQAPQINPGDEETDENIEMATNKAKHFLDDKTNVDNPFIKEYIQGIKQAKADAKKNNYEADDFDIEAPGSDEMDDLDEEGETKKELKKSFEQGYLEEDEYLNLLIKAEGSRGGKVIGHTKSGKPIYLRDNGYSSNFSSGEHREAEQIHSTHGTSRMRKVHKYQAKHMDHSDSLRVGQTYLNPYSKTGKSILRFKGHERSIVQDVDDRGNLVGEPHTKHNGWLKHTKESKRASKTEDKVGYSSIPELSGTVTLYTPSFTQEEDLERVKEELKKSISDFNSEDEYLDYLIKSRTQQGTYADTSENRKQGLVGQHYKKKQHQEVPPKSERNQIFVNTMIGKMNPGPFYETGLNDQQLTSLDMLADQYNYNPDQYRISNMIPSRSINAHFVELIGSDTGNYIISTCVKTDGELKNTFYNFKRY